MRTFDKIFEIFENCKILKYVNKIWLSCRKIKPKYSLLSRPSFVT